MKTPLDCQKKLFGNFESMYVSELDSKQHFIDYSPWIIHKKNKYADK